MSTELDDYTDAVATAEDRRRSQRAAQDVDAWLSGPETQRESGGQHARVVDLSLHGVGLETDKPLRMGERLWIVISAPAMRLSSRVRVVNCNQQPDGTYRCGGEFF